MTRKMIAVVPAMNRTFEEGVKRFIEINWEYETRKLDRIFMVNDKTFFTVVNGSRTYQIELINNFYYISVEVNDDNE